MSTILQGDYAPHKIIGPTIVGGFTQGLLQGILAYQMMDFFESESKDTRLLRSAVLFVNGISLIQTLIIGYEWWRLLVFNFGSEDTATTVSWPAMIQPILTTLMSTPVHFYLIYRCYMSTRKNRWLAAALGFLAIASWTFSIYSTVRDFQDPIYAAPTGSTPRKLRIGLVVWLACSAILDCCITTILLWYLTQSKAQSHSSYLSTLINRLMLLVWETATPPTVSAISALGAYIIPAVAKHGQVNWWSFFNQYVLGKLYCISFMITLNSRDSIRRQLDSDYTSSFHEPPLATSIHFNTPNANIFNEVAPHVTRNSVIVISRSDKHWASITDESTGESSGIGVPYEHGSDKTPELVSQP